MKSRLLILSFAIILLTLSTVASACGGGDDELKQALESLGENDLSIMVLPQEAYGDVAEGLQVDADSGFDDSDDVADSTLDPEDTGDDIEDAGFVTGYSLNFEDPAFSALEKGEGILNASSTVELFEDEQAASSHLDKLLEDNRRFQGEEVEPGTTLEDVEEFPVEGIADDATGLILHASYGDVDFYATGVIFTVGRLRAGAGITTADDGDVTADAERIGRALAERIEGVLVGDIDETPVPIPEAEDEEEMTVPPPEGIPDLAAMALSLDDLPAGVSVDREGYVEDEDTVASYEREFDLGRARIGSSQFISLKNDLHLYESSSEATLIFTTFEVLYASEAAAELFAAGFAEGGGFEAANVRAEPVTVPDLGDESFAAIISFDTPLGSFRAANIIVRIDRVIGLLILAGLAGEVDVADVVPLAEAMIERMAAGLAVAGEGAGEDALVPQEAVGIAEGFLQPFGLADALQPLAGPADLSLAEGGPLDDLVLSSEDLPPLYQKLFAGSSSFEIEPGFGEPSPGEVTMAMSMFADEGEQHMVMSMVMQVEDEAIAQEGLAEISELDLAEMEEMFAAYELFGIEVTNVRLVDASGLGEGGSGFGFTMDFSALIEELGEEPPGEEVMEFSSMDMEMVMFLDGSLVGMVMTTGVDDVAPASRPLAEKLAAKIAATS